MGRVSASASIYQIMRMLLGTFAFSLMLGVLVDICLIVAFVRSRKPMAYFWEDRLPEGGEDQKSLRLVRAEHT